MNRLFLFVNASIEQHAQSSKGPAQAILKMRVETAMALDQHLHTQPSALV